MTGRACGLSFGLLVLLCASAHAQVLTGLDVLESEGFKALQGKSVGIITNHTGKDHAGKSAVELLAKAPGVKLKAIFTPEHGFLGAEAAGAAIASTTDTATGLPIFSLYGQTKRPTPQSLEGLDVLVFDMQDVGARFYTYLSTMGMAMEEAAGRKIEFMVLDRPNPVGGAVIEGPVKIPEISAFTSYLPVPIRHGLTAGEMARLYNAYLETPVKLTVVPMQGWKRDMLWEETGLTWTNPSPNIRNATAALLYPGIGCFESTNLSVGRGTDMPFEWVGAPWLDARAVFQDLHDAHLAGFSFKVQSKTPKDDLYKDVECRGIEIRVKDPKAVRPVDLWVTLMTILRERYSYEFIPRFDEVRMMVGNDDFQKRYLGEEKPDAIIAAFHASAARFEKTRKPFLLYP